MACFEPGSLPTTTYDVFFETEDVTRPPRASMAALACSRVTVSSVPVSTNCSPWNAADAMWGEPASSVRTPASRRREISRRLTSWANQAWTDWATAGPIS